MWIDTTKLLITAALQSVIWPKLVSSITHKTDDDTFISYIYSSAFQIKINLLAIFNNVQLFYIKRTIFSVLAICFLIRLNQSHCFQVSTSFQPLLYFPLPPRGRWWRDILSTQILHGIYEGGYTPILTIALYYCPD